MSSKIPLKGTDSEDGNCFSCRNVLPTFQEAYCRDKIQFTSEPCLYRAPSLRATLRMRAHTTVCNGNTYIRSLAKGNERNVAFFQIKNETWGAEVRGW